MKNASLLNVPNNLAARRLAKVALCWIAAVAAGREAVAQQTIRRWEIEAVVVEMDDPDLIFGDVQLGDPVRGFLSYDRATPPADDDPTTALYVHEAGFVTAGMRIENPRDGGAIEFLPDLDGFWSSLLTLVGVGNDAEEPELSDDPYDSLLAIQSVLAPDGFSGEAPIVNVSLAGPGDILPDVSLPEALALEPWKLATLTFIDFFDLDVEAGKTFSSYVLAEIRSLTPAVPEPASAALALVGGLAGLLGWRRPASAAPR